VQGALTRQADKALAEAVDAGGCSREQVIAELLRLVTVDDQGRPTRWRVNRSELPDPVVTELEPFVRRRLLITDTYHGSVVMGVAHEAFLSAWSPLAQAIEENVSALRARRAIEQAAVEWNDEGRPSARLWERGQLAAAVADTGVNIRAHELVTERVELSLTARAFLRASVRRDRLRRGRAITVLSVLLVFAVVAAGYAFAQQHAAEQQRDVAVSRQVAGQATELRATNPALAAQLDLAAYRLAPTATEARSNLLSIFATPYATRLTDHTRNVNSVAVSLDGHILATGSADNTVRLWDVTDPHHPHRLGILTSHANSVLSVAFNRDGHTVATANADDTARLWDVSDPRNPHELSILTGHDESVASVAFSPDGRILATGSADITARLWDVSDPRNPHQLEILPGHTNSVLSVVFSPDGRTLATGSADNTARLWDLPGPIMLGHTNAVFSVAFSPDGHTLATASVDKTVRLWDVGDLRNPHQLGILTGYTSGVTGVAFSPDGRTLATGSADDTARLWDVSDPRNPHQLGILTGSTNIVIEVAFSPDGHTLATASEDNTAGLWDVSDLRNPHRLSTLTGHTDGVFSVAFSPDGRILATGSGKHSARFLNCDGAVGDVVLGVSVCRSRCDRLGCALIFW
ncbi:MAG: WD40 repeat domain-containing protein, partial [Pseudonocardiaceae bacterium]